MLEVLTRFLSGKLLYVTAVLAAGLYWGVAGFESHFQRRLETLRSDYAMESILSKRGSEFSKSFETIIEQAPVPEGSMLEQNAWIRQVQEWVRSSNLVLKELSPTASLSTRAGETRLSLTVEGSMSNILKFFYEMAQRKDWSRVVQFSLSAQEDPQNIRAELLIAQRGAV